MQAESIAAAAFLAQRTAKTAYWDVYRRLWAYAWRHLVDHQHGAWWCILRADNQKYSNEKSPAGKVDYHTMGACYEVINVLNNRYTTKALFIRKTQCHKLSSICLAGKALSHSIHSWDQYWQVKVVRAIWNVVRVIANLGVNLAFAPASTAPDWMRPGSFEPPGQPTNAAQAGYVGEIC